MTKILNGKTYDDDKEGMLELCSDIFKALDYLKDRALEGHIEGESGTCVVRTILDVKNELFMNIVRPIENKG